MQDQTLSILIEPVTQRGPFTDQRLVRNLHNTRVARLQCACRHQARVGKNAQHRINGACIGGTCDQFRESGAPARIQRVFTHLSQFDEDHTRDGLLLKAESLTKYRLGCLSDRASDSARSCIPRNGQDSSPAAFPCFKQGM